MSERQLISTQVLIVGGGPAGTSAGIHLHNQGFKTLIIDKAVFPRYKLCGGMVTGPALKVMARMGIDINDEEVFYRPKHVRFYSRKTVLNEYDTLSDFSIVEREVFDNHLMEHYKKNGGKVLEGQGLVRIDLKHSKAYTPDYKIKYKYCIGADGANSQVRKALNTSNITMALCLQTDVEKGEVMDGVNVHFNMVNVGFAWNFEARDYHHVGVGGFYTAEELRPILRKLAPYEQLKGAFVPYGNMPEILCKKNVFLIGDAAGFVDPILGEGIQHAIKAGSYMPDILFSDNPIKAYEKAFHDTIKLIKYGVKMRNVFFNPKMNKHFMHYFKHNPRTTEVICDKLVFDSEVQYYEIMKMLKLALFKV